MSEKIDEAVGLAVVTGAADKAGVGLGRKFNITVHGDVEFRGEMKFEEFSDLLRAMKRVHEKYHLALGSIVRYGNEHYGKEKVEELFTQLEFPHMDAVRAMAIGQLTMDFATHPSLEPDHYWVIASMLEGKEDEQVKWAKLAEKNDLTALELKNSIQKGSVVRSAQTAASSGRGSGGLGSFEAFTVYFEQWERRLGGRESILKGPRDVREQFLESTREVGELREAVAASLKGE